MVSYLVSYPGFIPHCCRLVSYPVSYWFHTLVSYPTFVGQFRTWFHTGFIYLFYTGFIPRRAIAIQCSGLSFVGCDDKGTNSLGDVAVLEWFHTGFIPCFIPVSYWFHTGFIPRRAIAIQCSGYCFVGFDDKGTISLGDVAVV